MRDDLERFGVSMEADLLEQFDLLLAQKRYASRSEAVRDLVRGWLNEEMTAEDQRRPAMGTLTLFYDHTRSDLSDRLTAIGHEHHQHVLSTLHFHIDHDRCLEVLALRGKVGELRKIAGQMIGLRGVENGKLVLTVQARGEKEHAHRHERGHPHH